jgi:type IV pilus assembly protein PilB
MQKIEKEILDLVPSQFAVRHKIIPLAVEDNTLTVGMTDPGNFDLLKDLMFITHRAIQPLEMDEYEILHAISENYQVPLAAHTGREQIKEFKLVKKTAMVYQADKTVGDDVSVIQGVNKYITNAINMGASDIHFEPFENQFRVRYRLDGRLVEIDGITMDKKFAYISRLKVMAELDIAEKRRPQDGRIRVVGGKKVVDIRVSTMPTDFGEKVVLRLLDKSALNLDMEQIGFTGGMRQQFEHILESPHGIILVTGPTGSGKTTTLYTALSYINKPDVNILTVEDPIEYNLEGINQTHVRPEIGFTFAKALRSFLRQDPDIIMVGEIRDSETAEIAIRAALTGHLVLSTLHTNDAPTAVTRLIDMGVEPFLVSSSLRMVMAQRLVRKICSRCKQETTADDTVLKRLDVEHGTFFRGKGCDYCNKTGFAGRTAVIEMLPVTEKIADLILAGATASRIRKTAKEEGMLTLREHALQKVFSGITTAEEILRETI